MNHAEGESPRAIDLARGGWTVRLGESASPASASPAPASIRGRDIPAEVPGCIHTDLIRAGLIADPTVGRHELDALWVGECDWTYRRRFVAPAALLSHRRVDLVCDGLDTIAAVTVNGRRVGSAANMFRPHRFDLRGAVEAGENLVEVAFRSPLRHIREEEARLGPRPVNGDWDPYVFIRKAACNFGWDWGPRVATCGVCGPIRVEAWNDARIELVRPLVARESGDRWTVRVHVELAWAGPLSNASAEGWTLSASLGAEPGRNISAETPVRHGQETATIALMVTNPRLWWPRGWGEQARHRLRVTLTGASRASAPRPVGVWSGSIGFRTVRLLTDPDPAGSRFALEVNGREVFCKGANWIPEGLFPADRSPERIRRRVAQAASANMNMLRVWGGGLYEDQAFYEECDRLGIMVWQDFMFACAMYPEEEPIRAEVESEARHQVARLSRHPSVVLWCGGNECVWAHECWGEPPHGPWKSRLKGATWGAGYCFDLLPRIIAELDPTRPYWANSPWPGGGEGGSREFARAGAGPNDADHGDRHTWDERVDGYTRLVPRFCSEFGHQSPACRETLALVLDGADLSIGSPGLEHRQRGTGGTPRHIDGALAKWFRPAANFDEWHYLAGLLQARAMRVGVEWLRANQPRCMGALIWQLNDAWPGLSWSLIDADGREKPAYRAVRDSMRDRIVTIGPRHDRPAVWLCNDRDDPWCGELTLGRRAFDGRLLGAAFRAPFELPGRSARRLVEIGETCGRPDDPTAELVVAEADGLRRCWYHAPDRELRYPPPVARMEVRTNATGRPTLKVHALSLIRDIGGAFAGHEVAGGLGTLLPGESASFGLGGGDARTLPLPAIPSTEPAWPAGLMCANLFGAPARAGPALTP